MGNLSLYASIIIGCFFLFRFFTLGFRLNEPSPILVKIIIAFLTVISILNLGKGWDYFVFLATDFATFGMFCFPIILSKSDITTEKFKIFLISLFFIAFISFLSTLPDVGSSLIGIDRTDVFRQTGSEFGFNKVYFIQATTVGYFSLILYSLPLVFDNTKPRYIDTIVFVIVLCVIYYILIFQKRQNSINLVLFLIFLFVFFNKYYDGIFRNKIFLFFVFLMIIFGELNFGYFNTIYERFAEVKTVDNFDRYVEISDIISEFTFMDYFSGHGFAWSSSRAISTGHVVHVGYLNLLMKGGFSLILVYIFFCINNMAKCFLSLRFSYKYYVGIFISLVSMIELSYSPGYGPYLTSVFTGFAMFSHSFIERLLTNDRLHTSVDYCPVDFKGGSIG